MDSQAGNTVDNLDFAASPTLTTLRGLIGEGLTVKLVRARGGTDVYLPSEVTSECQLALLVGTAAAARIVDHFGSHRNLDIPTGRGIASGRRIDRSTVKALYQEGMSVDNIARRVGCTARTVRNIISYLRQFWPVTKGRKE